MSRVFDNTDYESGDGMLTSVWGPPLWHFLHTMSFNYPVNPTIDEKHHYMDFIKNLEYTLPCKYCRINFKKNLKSLPITLTEMESRNTFSKYVFQLHELINKMLNKKSNLTYDDVRETYEHFRARCTKPKTIKKTEKGCIKPLYGEKSKCILRVIPQKIKAKSFVVDKKCFKHRTKSQTRKNY